MKRASLLAIIACACAGMSVFSSACKPAAIFALEGWLDGYAKDDGPKVIEWTYSTDRELVRAALEELRTVPTGTLATALPPRPMRYQIIEVEAKENGRWTVLVKTTLKNPLPFMSKKVGHMLEDMPKTRDQRRRYLVVEDGEHWGIKLDLDRVLARNAFAGRFFALLESGKIDEAEAMLKAVPPPPDEANALKKSDRLRDTLTAEITKARRANAPKPVKTSPPKSPR